MLSMFINVCQHPWSSQGLVHTYIDWLSHFISHQMLERDNLLIIHIFWLIIVLITIFTTNNITYNSWTKSRFLCHCRRYYLLCWHTLWNIDFLLILGISLTFLSQLFNYYNYIRWHKTDWFAGISYAFGFNNTH